MNRNEMKARAGARIQTGLRAGGCYETCCAQAYDQRNSLSPFENYGQFVSCLDQCPKGQNDPGQVGQRCPSLPQVFGLELIAN